MSVTKNPRLFKSLDRALIIQVCLETPMPSNFHDEWTKWRKPFEQFRKTSKLVADTNTKQVNMLLYCLNEEVEGVLTSTHITEDEYTVYMRWF